MTITPETLTLLTALLGQVMPPIADTINRNIPNSKIRFWVSILLSAVVGVLLNINNLNFGNLDGIIYSSMLLWGSSQIAYKTYYEDSKVQSRIRFSKVL